MVRGFDSARVSAVMALYEPKTIEPELEDLGVRIRHVSRRRLPKEHGLLKSDSYQRAKKMGAVTTILRTLRQGARLVAEEMPAAWQLARIVREENIDVIHLGNGVRANFDGILAGMMTGKPVICHVKGFEKYSGRERWGARRLSALVCMTEAIDKHCRDNGVIAPRQEVIYDAVDPVWLEPKNSRAEVRSALSVDAEVPLLIISGNIQEWKGQAVLVEAFAQIAASHPSAQCLVAGGVHRAGEHYADTLRGRIADLGLTDRIRFLGFRDDIPDLMNAVDIVVHASVRPEPFGRVILEGMLAGRLVVAANAGGVRELIETGKTGYLVEPGNPTELAQCLDRALAEPERSRDMGSTAQRWATEKFSLVRHVEQMCDLYETSVRNGSR